MDPSIGTLLELKPDGTDMVLEAIWSFKIIDPFVLGCPWISSSSFIARGIPSKDKIFSLLEKYLFSDFLEFNNASS